MNKYLLITSLLLLVCFPASSLGDAELYKNKAVSIPKYNLNYDFEPHTKYAVSDMTQIGVEELLSVIITLHEPWMVWGELDSFSVAQHDELKKMMVFTLNKSSALEVQEVFMNSKGFSARIRKDQREAYEQHPFVKSIQDDIIVSVFLDDSVPLIHADRVWNYTSYGVNLTGQGQVVCVIDTGIDYTHQALGACEQLYNISSEEILLNTTMTSPSFPNNYPDNYFGFIGEITHAGADSIQVVYDHFDLEEGYDFVLLYDKDDVLVSWQTGTRQAPYYGGTVPGDTVKIYFSSDGNVTQTGFSIHSYVAHNTEETCEKILGGHDFAYDTIDPIDTHGHGTHVAGIIAAEGIRKGVAYDARLVAVKALNNAGDGLLSDVIAGIEYCTQRAQSHNITVISMSLGGGAYTGYCDDEIPVLTQAINDANEHNISVIVATGNEGHVNSVSIPACVEQVIRVGSTTKEDAVSGFSNRWALEMLMAPGSSIRSTIPQDMYAHNTGTSMATPHVSGAIALINQYMVTHNTTISPRQLYETFYSTGTTVTADQRNYSRINAWSALSAVLKQSPVVTITSPNSDGLWYNNYVSVNYTITETNATNCWWTRNEGLTNNTINCSVAITAQNWTQGSNVVTVYAESHFGKKGNDTRQFNIDTIAPHIIIIQPAGDDSWYNTSSVEVEYIVIEEHIESCWYELEDNISTELVSCQNITEMNLPEGVNNITLYANDSAGNINYSVRIINIDLTQPQISIVTPENTTYTNNTVLINISSSDELSGIETVWRTLQENESTQYEEEQYVVLLDGTHSLSAWAIDRAGNRNQTNITFSIDTQAPQYNSITTSLPLLYDENSSYWFNITLQDASGISSAYLYLKNSTQEEYIHRELEGVADEWALRIRNLTVDNYSYYFWANDTVGNKKNITSTATFTVIHALNDSQEELNSTNYTVPPNITEIIIETTNNLENISIPSNNSNNVSIQFLNTPDNTIYFPHNTTLRRETQNKELLVMIPKNTTMNVNATWNGNFILPRKRDINIEGIQVSLAVQVGTQHRVSFDKPVKILLQGEAGKKAAWLEGDIVREINTTCNNVSLPTNIDRIETPHMCNIVEEEDIIIWTYHFSTYMSYEEIEEQEEPPDSGTGTPSSGSSRRSTSVNILNNPAVSQEEEMQEEEPENNTQEETEIIQEEAEQEEHTTTTQETNVTTEYEYETLDEEQQESDKNHSTNLTLYIITGLALTSLLIIGLVYGRRKKKSYE